ncbi:MAG: cobalamin biosynthesis protein CobW, partial [Fibrobacter sp.]|nr:cobalamin biosynthesis protein CobW [Fibrobacter sp.]
VAESSRWAIELNRMDNDMDDDNNDDDHDEHEHHHHDEHEHHHHHDHEEEDHSHCDHEHGVCHCGHHHDEDHPHGDEYGISTFVYERKPPVNRKKFEAFLDDYPSCIIRTKGLMWFSDEPTESYLFEQAGKQASAQNFGRWFAAESKEVQQQLLRENPQLANIWDEKYGDRTNRLVFIGQHMDKKKIIAAMDSCLEKE